MLVLPAQGTAGVLVKKVSSSRQLFAIEGNHESQVLTAFCDGSLDLLGIHVGTVNPNSPCTKWSAGRRAHDPVWVFLINELSGGALVRLLGQVPWGPIGLQRPQVDGREAIAIEGAPASMRSINDPAMPIGLN